MARNIRINAPYLVGKNNKSLKEQGFTFIEIMVVLTIFTLVVTISYPYLTLWYSSLKIRGVQRELVSSLRHAQQSAVTSQDNHLVRFDTLANSYDIIKKNGVEETIKTIFLPANISFSMITLEPVHGEVEFNAAAVPNSIGSITIINNKGETKDIDITPSGFVRGD